MVINPYSSKIVQKFYQKFLQKKFLKSKLFLNHMQEELILLKKNKIIKSKPW